MVSPPTLLSPPPVLRIAPEPLTAAAFSSFGTVVSAPTSLPDSIPPRSAEELAEIIPEPPYSPPSITRALHPKNPKGEEVFSAAIPVLANQNSAVKISPVSPFSNFYQNDDSGIVEPPSGRHGQARMSMFSCYPRKLRTANNYLASTSPPPPFSPSDFDPQLRKHLQNSDVQSLLDDYVGENDNNGSNIGGGSVGVGVGDGDSHGTVFDITILERHPYTSQTLCRWECRIITLVKREVVACQCHHRRRRHRHRHRRSS